MHNEWFNLAWDLQIWQFAIIFHEEDNLVVVEQLEENCTPICEPCENGRFFAQVLSNEEQQYL